jgi:hypothetical protein
MYFPRAAVSRSIVDDQTLKSIELADIRRYVEGEWNTSPCGLSAEVQNTKIDWLFYARLPFITR